jgi:hypothetical protein
VVLALHTSFLGVEVGVHTASHALSGWLPHQVADFLRDFLKCQLFASWICFVAQKYDLTLVVEIQPARVHHLAHHWHGVKRTAECQRRTVSKNSYNEKIIYMQANSRHKVRIFRLRPPMILGLSPM